MSYVAAVVTYVIPTGDCPTKTAVITAINDGKDESVHDFYARIGDQFKSCDVIRVELVTVRG